jgi:Flp pilus assembly protein TadG
LIDSDRKQKEGFAMKWINEKGAAVVEFAIVLPLLLVIVFGIVEFGFVMYNQAMLTNAAREGARFGITIGEERKSTAQITQVVNDYCADYLFTFKSGSATAPETVVKVNGVETDPFGGLQPAQDYVTVEVSYSYDFLILPSFITNLGVSKNLAASATMRAE